MTSIERRSFSQSQALITKTTRIPYSAVQLCRHGHDDLFSSALLTCFRDQFALAACVNPTQENAAAESSHEASSIVLSSRLQRWPSIVTSYSACLDRIMAGYGEYRPPGEEEEDEEEIDETVRDSLRYGVL